MFSDLSRKLMMAALLALAQQGSAEDISAVSSPLMSNEYPSAELEAANAAFTNRVQQTLQGEIACDNGICIKAPPFPYEPVSPVIDYVAEQSYNEFLEARTDIARCADQACAELVVQQAPGVEVVQPGAGQ